MTLFGHVIGFYTNGEVEFFAFDLDQEIRGIGFFPSKFASEIRESRLKRQDLPQGPLASIFEE